MTGGRGASIEAVVAERIASLTGGTVIRRRDGFVVVYKKRCGENGCRRVLVWVRKSPVNSKTVEYLRRLLRRVAHDEVYMVKLYRDPDFTEEHLKIINGILSVDEAIDRLGGGHALAQADHPR